MKYELTEKEGLAIINLGLTGIVALERVLREFREWSDRRDDINYDRTLTERREALEAHRLEAYREKRLAAESLHRSPEAHHFESDYERAGFSTKLPTPEGPSTPVSAVRGMATPPSAPPPIPPTGPVVGEWHAPPTGSFPPTMHANAPIPGGGKIPDPEVASPDRIPMVAISEERLTMGRLAFIRLLGVWDQGFREDVPQPDRQRAMADIANGSAAYPVLRVVHDAGGLTCAVACYLAAAHVDIPAYVAEEHGFERRVLSLTDNIVQVASLIFPDLAALYEHKNIFPGVVPDDPFFSRSLTFSDTGLLPVTTPEAS